MMSTGRKYLTISRQLFKQARNNSVLPDMVVASLLMFCISHIYLTHSFFANLSLVAILNCESFDFLLMNYLERIYSYQWTVCGKQKEKNRVWQRNLWELF